MAPRPRVPYKYPGTQTPVWVDIYNLFYRERTIFLSQAITDSVANQIVAVLLYLQSENASKPVTMYFNSVGGIRTSGLAIYDTMRYMPYDIQTMNLGVCAQVSAYLVAGGTKGRRFALPNSTFVMQNPVMMPDFDQEGNPVVRPMQATEMKIEVEQVLREKKLMLQGFSSFTGRSTDLLEQDFRRDFYLDAEGAKAYGLIDGVLQPKSSQEPKTLDSLFSAYE
jgi:ATP-dependent Clp protease protease subunit